MQCYSMSTEVLEYSIYLYTTKYVAFCVYFSYYNMWSGGGVCISIITTLTSVLNFVFATTSHIALIFIVTKIDFSYLYMVTAAYS